MLSEEQAQDVCREEAERRGWTWLGTIRVTAQRSFLSRGRVTTYEVLSNADCKGTQCKFVVDADTGAFVRAHFLPR